ncbi:hypothetical protein TSOC_011360 [Tetrabaena socialis]|uniref:Rho-GAP domain-containing protein n=1 Tax=Tetrabaena socialis TaxID=47790 RepID=A0A2J7ZQV1_9CHLO|nr:hypothetical protein TSOC_011360 [Tetrabaena socialis]|eukprot:PNH02645.1 hypothetical protein TSOC_011360 [Tetrabaena socialis]
MVFGTSLRPDVFAQAPKCAATSQIKGDIDGGAVLCDLLNGTCPAVVGSLLKRWLEELPEPLLSWDQQVELLSACKDEGCIEARITSLNDAVALVDHITLGTLKPLLLFLQQYCFRQRRFDQQLLQVAVAFAPILFPAALAAGAEELRLAEETVATLVSNALHIFNPALAANVPVVTPQALCEAAAEMRESEDEQQQAQYDEDQQMQQQVWMGEEEARAHMLQHQQQHLQRAESGGAAPEHLLPERPASPVEWRRQQQRQPYEGGYDDEYETEPYMHDPAFITEFHTLVEDCVTSSLFSYDSDDEYEYDSGSDCHSGSAARGGRVRSSSTAAAGGEEDDCASLGSFASYSGFAALLSSGGASSGGGAYAIASAPSPPQHHIGAGCYASHGEPAATEATLELPYSPNTEVVPLPLPCVADGWSAPELVAGPAPAAHVFRHPAAGKTMQPHFAFGPAHVTAGSPKAAAATSTAADAFTTLTQREVAQGGVICIISAQPGAAALAAAVAASSAAAAAAAPKDHHLRRQQPPYLLAPTPSAEVGTEATGRHGLTPINVAELLLEQAALLCEPQTQAGRAASAGARPRLTEGGAISPGHAQGHGHAAGASRPAGRMTMGGGGPAAGDAAVVPSSPGTDRRVTMGGGGLAAALPQQHRQQQQLPHQYKAQQQLLRSPPPSSGGGAACSPRRRQTMGGDGGRGSSGGGDGGSGGSSVRSGGGSSVRSGGSSGGGGLSFRSGGGSSGGGVGTTAGASALGYAGYLQVFLSADRASLLVVENTTPAAAAHRLPIKSLPPAAMACEKELLKRQLKDVSAAYERLIGAPLTPSLKEPLRPVYVRYHKIKALIAGGAVAACSGRKQVLATPPTALTA